MHLTETVYNEINIDIETLYNYFTTLEGELPTIEGLVDFINDTYYMSDFTIDTEIKYYGDGDELYELYNKYLND